jgi:hypothetical protein
MNLNENTRPSLLPEAIASTKAETIAALAVRLRGLPGIDTSAEAVRQACEVLEISESARRFCAEREGITREGSYEEGIQIYLEEQAGVVGRIPRHNKIDLTYLAAGYDEETGKWWEMPDDAVLPFNTAIDNCLPEIKVRRDRLKNVVRFFADTIFLGDTKQAETLMASWQKNGEIPVGGYHTLKRGLPLWRMERDKRNSSKAGKLGAAKREENKKAKGKQGRVRSKKDGRLGARCGDFYGKIRE